MEVIAGGADQRHDAREQVCLAKLPLNLQQLPLETLRVILSSFQEKIQVFAHFVFVDCNVP